MRITPRGFQKGEPQLSLLSVRRGVGNPIERVPHDFLLDRARPVFFPRKKMGGAFQYGIFQ